MGISISEYKKMIGQDTKKDYKRQLQGRINHEIGEDFENRISAICEYYEQLGLARIEKTPEPMKILKHIDNGHFETVFTKMAQPDFKGCIKGGRTVVFDAKYTTSNRITYQVLSEHQREALLIYNNLGAMSFIIVGFATGDIYKIEIDTWSKMQQIFGRKYMLQSELDEMGFKVRKDKKGVLDIFNLSTHNK